MSLESTTLDNLAEFGRFTGRHPPTPTHDSSYKRRYRRPDRIRSTRRRGLNRTVGRRKVGSMRLTRDVALVGGGDSGFNISAPLDCHVYLLDGGEELALVDAGVGHRTGNTGQILDNIRADGYDPTNISRLLLTHYHAD